MKTCSLLKFIIVFLPFFFFCAKPLLAQENFDTTADVTYDIFASGVTRATLKLNLINKTSTYIASSYKIHIGLDNLTQVTVSDSIGQLTPDIQKTPDGYEINVQFRKRVVGKGNKLPFTIAFNTDDIAQKQGTLWEINIPGIAYQNDFSSFIVRVNVPDSFGVLSYSKPQVSSNDFTFTKEQLGASGISLAFGSARIYEFTLKYHIKNSHVFPIKTEIALPPTTNYQDISLIDITPKPLNVREDKDGNWLALYNLSPSQNMDITAKGYAKLSLIPKKVELSLNDRSQYLQEKQYWEVSNARILKLAKSLKTPKAIYEYVVKTLTYDFSRVTERKGRLGAASVLQNSSSAVCLEFTDLFIALSRAAGIPAREVDGFAYTQNTKQRPLSLVNDLLHAWPEYYDKQKQTWIMVDPTWGNTTGGVDYFSTLDYDHFAFAVKGSDSNFPLPAGGYKLSNSSSEKDIFVIFAKDTSAFTTPAVQISPNFSQMFLSELPITGSVKIQNTGTVLYPAQDINIHSNLLIPTTQTVRAVPVPPFGKIDQPISFNAPSFLTNTQASITIQAEKAESVVQITITPFSFKSWILIIGGVLFATGTIFTLFIIARKSRRLPLS